MVDLIERKKKNQDPDWGDIDLMMGEMIEMMESENQLILKTAWVHVQAQIAIGTAQDCH